MASAGDTSSTLIAPSPVNAPGTMDDNEGSFAYSNYAHALPGPLLTSPASFLGGPLGSSSAIPPVSMSAGTAGMDDLLGFSVGSTASPSSLAKWSYGSSVNNTAPAQHSTTIPSPNSTLSSLADLWVGNASSSVPAGMDASSANLPWNSEETDEVAPLPSPMSSADYSMASTSMGLAPVPSSIALPGAHSPPLFNMYHARALSEDQEVSSMGIAPSLIASPSSSATDPYPFFPPQNATFYPPHARTATGNELVPLRVPLVRCASAPFTTPTSPTAPLLHLSLPPSSSGNASTANAAPGPARPRRSRCPSADQEKTFMCEVQGCGRMFKRSEHLSRHARMHSGEKPFLCNYPGCGRAFSRSDNLAAHRRRHDKAKDEVLLTKQQLSQQMQQQQQQAQQASMKQETAEETLYSPTTPTTLDSFVAASLPPSTMMMGSFLEPAPPPSFLNQPFASNPYSFPQQQQQYQQYQQLPLPSYPPSVPPPTTHLQDYAFLRPNELGAQDHF